MTVFEYIILLFKRPGVPGKSERKKKKKKKHKKRRLLNSPKPMTEIFTFKLEQSLNDTETRLFLDKYT